MMLAEPGQWFWRRNYHDGTAASIGSVSSSDESVDPGEKKAF